MACICARMCAWRLGGMSRRKQQASETADALSVRLLLQSPGHRSHLFLIIAPPGSVGLFDFIS